MLRQCIDLFPFERADVATFQVGFVGLGVNPLSSISLSPGLFSLTLNPLLHPADVREEPPTLE